MWGCVLLLGSGPGYGQQRACAAESAISSGVPAVFPDHSVLPRTAPCIPVVFHLVSNGEDEHFSDLEFIAQLDVLNRDFQLRGENLVRIPGAFRDVAADAKICFCLAAEDPAGSPTTGIVRRETTVRDIGSAISPEGRRRIHYDFLGGSDAWDPDRYVNIWVGAMDGVIGFATFPGEAAFPEEDGVIIDPAFFGTLRPSPANAPNRGHTLTHEMGHYLNLHHLWGANNSPCEEGDFVDDTPVQEGPHFGCPSHPVISCGSPDMFMNFMDFTSDECIAFFTHGQVQRMHLCLDHLRTGLTGGTVACHLPSPDIHGDLEDSIVTSFLKDRQAILVRQTRPTAERIEITVFAYDGRLLGEYRIKGESTLLIPADSFSTGFIVLLFQAGNDFFSRKIALY